jgi:hypothetical protein
MTANLLRRTTVATATAALVLGVGAATAVAATTPRTAPHTSAATTTARIAVHHQVVPSCPDGRVASPGAGTIEVTIPRLVEVKVDDAGTPVLVRDNTARTPCRGDQWLLLRPDGVWHHGVPVAIKDQVLAGVHGGIWPAWTWQRVATSGGGSGI